MPADPAPPPRAFLQSIPARVLAVSAALLLVVLILQSAIDLPAAVVLLRRVVALILIVSAGWLLGALVIRNWRHFLWRVRRKLLLSYLFLSVVPVVLVLAFALAGGLVLYDNLASYLFRRGLDDVVEDVESIARNVAAEVSRVPGSAQAAIATRYANWSAEYPELSLAVLPHGSDAATAAAGPWRHGSPPREMPGWVRDARGMTGVTARAVPDDTPAAAWVIRSVAATADGRRFVVVDLPLAFSVFRRIEDRTGLRVLELGSEAAESGNSTPFRRTVTLLDTRAWGTGQAGQAAVNLDAPVLALLRRIASAQSAQLSSNLNRGLTYILILLAVLFAIIQAAALVMGGALARSITNAVHELFTGTERVREGDFSHRIRVGSQDQLGDLADSFNRMSASIEHLLHVQREKQRLDDELRIARDIQRSLLPVQPPCVPGLRIADLCQPAREVGGDYYDFFEVGPRQLGVLIADVSGKGTSAALYMAELKGLMLALSHSEASPGRLLRTVNHLLAEHLDNRSFITATYAVVDLDRMTMTCARAGHTPLIVVSGSHAELVVPEGMVLGLRLPGAAARFDALLEERTCPLRSGDLIVLYTDGITEAMDGAGELFGDGNLARVLSAAGDLAPAAVRERVVREVRAFVGDAEPHDDMTMVAIRIDAPGREHAERIQA